MYCDRIKELRKAKGLTQVDLALELEVAKGTVAMWETGKRRPSYEALEAMSHIFNKRVDYIMGYDEGEYSPDITEDEMFEINRWREEKNYYETIKRYLRLDSYGRMNVDNLINSEIKRCVAQHSDVSRDYITFSIEVKDEVEGEEDMKVEGHVTRGLKVLGKDYTTQIIDMENCIYRDLGNGIDFEISYSYYKGYRIYVWLNRNIIVENTDIIKLKDLKATMDDFVMKYKDIDREKFTKEINEKFWGKGKKNKVD